MIKNATVTIDTSTYILQLLEKLSAKKNMTTTELKNYIWEIGLIVLMDKDKLLQSIHSVFDEDVEPEQPKLSQ